MTTFTRPGAEGAYLAHISDTVTATEQQVARLSERQDIVIAILTRMSEDLRVQSEMLAEILAAACSEPGPSPVAELLRSLTDAVTGNTAALTGMAEDLATMPAEIGEAITQAISSNRSSAA